MSEYIGYNPLKEGVLPSEGSEKLVMAPSINRWGKNDQQGPLPNMISSVGQAISREDLGDKTWMIISDASNTPGVGETRAQALQSLDLGERPARLFFLLPEQQAKVAEMVKQRTGLPERVINATLRGIGYGGHRETLDTIARAITYRNGPQRVLTVDDDVVIPQQHVVWRKDAVPNGHTSRPNSQVLHSSKENGASFPPELFDVTGDNKIAPLFDPLGKTVGQIREEHPTLRATASVKDTRSDALIGALNGETTQFELTHADEEDVPNTNEAVIAATTLTKTKLPDYPTGVIARAYLQGEFPDQEVPIESYRSGPSELFAARGSNTIFPDSAVFGRLFDNNTALWRWWFVSSLEVSLENKLKSVTGHYRADNDHLPILFNIMLEQTGQQYMYLSVDTEAYHSRARLGGNRQEMHEQAASSRIGNIAAVEATSRLELDRTTGLWKINRRDLINEQTGLPNEQFQASYDHAIFAFNDLSSLATICTDKIRKLNGQLHTARGTDTQERVRGLIERYTSVHTSLKGKLANFNFDEFYRHVSQEVRDQVLFYADVVDAVPAVTLAVSELIRQGRYPVSEYRPQAERILSYPVVNGRLNGNNGHSIER